MPDEKLSHRERSAPQRGSQRHRASARKESDGDGSEGRLPGVRLSARPRANTQHARRTSVSQRQQHLVPLQLARNWSVQSVRWPAHEVLRRCCLPGLIHGSNLDRPLADTPVNLTTAGLQRHRVLWVREMTEEEIRQIGEAGTDH